DLILWFEAVAAVALVHLRLHRAVLEARRECSRTDHLRHHVPQPLLVVRRSRAEERAPLRDAAAGVAALGAPGVRGRPIIPPPAQCTGARSPREACSRRARGASPRA